MASEEQSFKLLPHERWAYNHPDPVIRFSRFNRLRSELPANYGSSGLGLFAALASDQQMGAILIVLSAVLIIASKGAWWSFVPIPLGLAAVGLSAFRLHQVKVIGLAFRDGRPNSPKGSQQLS